MNYNKVILIGRLVRAPENIQLSSGSVVSNLVIAYNRNYKDASGQWKEESHFFEVKVFGNLVERVIPQLNKGDLVLIEGRLHQDKWIDKKSGEPRSKIRIVALDIKPLTRKGAQPTVSEPTVEEGLPEIPDLPDLEPEKLAPPKGDSFDIEKDLFGEETKEPPKGDKKKDEDFDDFDIF